jgi:hypothetical protein
MRTLGMARKPDPALAGLRGEADHRARRATSETTRALQLPNAPLPCLREDTVGQRPDLMDKSLLQNPISIIFSCFSYNIMIWLDKRGKAASAGINDLHGLML